MVVFRLTGKLGLSLSKQHSFGDKSIPPDYIRVHIGFLSVIIPMEERAFSKHFKMYIGDDYEYHTRVRREVAKQRSKLAAYYLARNGVELESNREQIRDMNNRIIELKEDVRSLVRVNNLKSKCLDDICVSNEAIAVTEKK